MSIISFEATGYRSMCYTLSPEIIKEQTDKKIVKSYGEPLLYYKSVIGYKFNYFIFKLKKSVMSKHFANAHWEGNLPRGSGKYTLKSSGHEGSIKFSSRFEDDKSASSPEELIGAALASCFSMALSHDLDQAGHTPERIETEAEVILAKSGDGFLITEILLKTRGKVKGMEKKQFQESAGKAKENCPVSQALTGVNIKLEAELV